MVYLPETKFWGNIVSFDVLIYDRDENNQLLIYIYLSNAFVIDYLAQIKEYKNYN